MNNESEADEFEARLAYLRNISQTELFKLENDEELCNATFQMTARVWGDNMDLRSESDEEQLVVLVWMMDGIIGNGGFDALFEGAFKADPEFSACVDSLDVISAKGICDVLKKALDIAGQGPAKVRQRHFEAQPLDFRRRLAREWYKQRPELISKLAHFIRSNEASLKSSWRRARAGT